MRKWFAGRRLLRQAFQSLPGSNVRRTLLTSFFYVMVDAIIREWIHQVGGNDAARSGMGEELQLQNFLSIFYADNGLIQARCPERLQSSFTILVKLFEHVGLRTNTSKTKAMVCVPGRIGTCLTEAV